MNCLSCLRSGDPALRDVGAERVIHFPNVNMWTEIYSTEQEVGFRISGMVRDCGAYSGAQAQEKAE